MGRWGMGITQSDEYGDVYDQFMEAYDNGKSVPEITERILEMYHREFSDDDGILHDVYFALAKAEWMCGEQSSTILQRVKEIIESGANIEFFLELEATEKQLKERQRRLTTFYKSLQTPRETIRKRKVRRNLMNKPLPKMEIGDCYSYNYEDGKRILIILDWLKPPRGMDEAFCCILKKTYSLSEVKKVEYLTQEIGHIASYIGEQFLVKSNIKKIGKINLPTNIEAYTMGIDGVHYGYRTDFYDDFSSVPSLTLSTFLNTKLIYRKMQPELRSKYMTCVSTRPGDKEQVFYPEEIRIGDVYAIKDHEKYRIFALTEKKGSWFSAIIFGYAWRESFDEIPSYEQLLQGDVIPLGWYVVENFPEMSELTWVGNFQVFTQLDFCIPKDINPCWEPANKCLLLKKHLFEEYPVELCMPMKDALDKVKKLKEKKLKLLR